MTRGRRPTVMIVAGPNGAGKSTLTTDLRRRLPVPVIDPDAIARQLAPDALEHAAIEAGREAIRRRNRYLEASVSFIVETTLSGQSIMHLFDHARECGFRVHLVFVGVENPQMLIDRVASRVAQGGHGVPSADIFRRYTRSMHNLSHAATLADRVTIFDNSVEGTPRCVAAMARGRITWRTQAIPSWVVTHLQLRKGQSP